MTAMLAPISALDESQLYADGQILWRGTVLGTGTPYALSALAGWLDLPGQRGSNQPIPARHGSYPGRKVSEDRVITLDWRSKGVDLAGFRDAMATLRRITAPDEDPQEEPLVVRLDGESWMTWARCTRRLIPTDRLYALGIAAGSVQWEATDPRIYSVNEQTVTTTLPTPAVGGLDFGTAKRVNLARNPSFEDSADGWTPYNAGSSIARVPLATPVPGVAAGSYGLRITCATAGSWGASHTLSGVVAGQWYNASTYGWPSVARDVRVYLEWRNAAGAVLATNYMTTAAVAAGAWTRVQISRQAPAGAATVVVSVVGMAGVVGDTLTIDAAQVERSASDTAASAYTSRTVLGGLDFSAGGLDFGGGRSGGLVRVTNVGDVPTWPVLEITGPVTGPVVTIGDRSLSFDPSFTVLAGQVLTIVTKPGVRTVELNGVSARPRLWSRQWAPLEPLVSTDIRFTAAAYSAAALLTVRYRHAKH